MYQSLHTSVFGVDGYIFEVQVRTYDMDEIAEKGIASHWSYKEHQDGRIKNVMEQKLELFRNLIEQSNETTNDVEFSKQVSNELLNGYIYCFTPKGDVVELPKDATPIDFAYRIHSHVGDTCIGAIVNDNIVPLDQPLHDGDIISIRTNNSSKPAKEWLNIVKTTQAKNKIKSYFSKQDRENYINKGKELIEKEIRKRKLSISEVLSNDNLNKVVDELKLIDIDDVYLSIGSLRYTAGYIINVIYEDKKNVQDILLEKVIHRPVANLNHKSDIIVDGADDILVSMAKCCKPIKGDEIIGYITKGQGITIHKKDCINVANESDRLINVHWNDKVSNAYLTDVEVETITGKNYLLDIITKASLKNINVESVSTSEYVNGTIITLTLKINSREELESYINDLKKLKFIKKVERVNH